MNTGEAEYYQFDLPAGQPALNASITLANNPDNATNAWLVDPAGQVEAFQSNTLITLGEWGQSQGHQHASGSTCT